MNSSQGLYMDTDAVRGMASGFNKISDVLRGVSQAVEALALLAKTNACLGQIGNACYSECMTFKAEMDTWADKASEISTDLEASVRAYENGDAEGATRFH